jgi:hypothetical protein
MAAALPFAFDAASFLTAALLLAPADAIGELTDSCHLSRGRS